MNTSKGIIVLKGFLVFGILVSFISCGKEGSFAAIARSYAIADREIILPTPVNQFYLPPSGSYNAELVKQLSPEMQVKIQNYGTPIGK